MDVNRVEPLTQSIPSVVPVDATHVRVRAESSMQRRPNEPVAKGIRVEMVRRESGIDVLRVLDRDTGEQISQLPPEQVLHIVEQVIARLRRQETSDGND